MPYAVSEFAEATLRKNRDLLRKYEGEVKATLNFYNFHVLFVDASETILNGGAMHCLSRQVPRS